MMPATRSLQIFVITIVVVSPAWSSRADESPGGPIAHLSFNGHFDNTSDGEAEFEARSTEFRDDALYLNGKYEFGQDTDGFHALCRTPDLNYKTFTVALRFRAEEFSPTKSTLLVGGTSARWFGLARSRDGNLVVTFNNGNFRREIENAPLKPDLWTVVTCTVDLPARKAAAYLDGKPAGKFDLPEDFRLEVTGTKAETKDKVWSFANYANANVFHGLVDELIIHNRPLSPQEVLDQYDRIPLKDTPQRSVDEPPAKEDARDEILTRPEQEILDLVNKERFKAGLKPLKASVNLTKAARGHAENMARQETLNHTLDGRTFDLRIDATGYRYSAAGENISNAPSGAEAFAGWMASPGHQRNMLSPDYQDIGIGVGTAKSKRKYWTQVFGKPDRQNSERPKSKPTQEK